MKKGKGKTDRGTMHIESHKGDDMADSDHKKHNKAHGMAADAFGPSEGYQGREGAGGGAPTEKCD